MSIISFVKSNKFFKSLVLRIMIAENDHRPRLWVRLFLNPFRHHKGEGVIVRSRTRLDVFPFRTFTVGSKSIIEDFATINNGVGSVVIGQRTIIGLGNTIIGPVKIGDDVMLAQNVVVSGMNHGYEDVNVPPSKQQDKYNEISIANAVWIGANTVITAGIKIGEHSVIGAGSVVTRDIPPFCVAVGNPAKVIKKYNSMTLLWERV